MTDKQKSIVSLTFASETCCAALALLSKRQQEPHPEPPPEPHVLRQDLVSLLSLLHSSATKLALALKPSSPTYSASLTPLKDISTHTSALVHCASLFDPAIHGATLIQEIVSVVTDVIEAIKSLLHTFLSLEVDAPANRNEWKAGAEYLVRVGSVHEVIDKARNSDGISGDNIVAVRKKWTVDKMSLEDVVREVGEMIEDEEAEVPGNSDAVDSNVDGDGWDELGMPSGEKMEKEELECTKKVHNILRLTALLHKRILLDLLPLPSVPSSSNLLLPSNAGLDLLLVQSSALLAASDDLVSTLYTPQDGLVVNAELLAFVAVVEALQTRVQDFFPETAVLEGEMKTLSLTTSETNNSGGKKNVRTWFDTCFEQIYKTSRTLALTLTESQSRKPAID